MFTYQVICVRSGGSEYDLVTIRPRYTTGKILTRSFQILTQFYVVKISYLTRKIRQLQPLSPNDQIGPPGPARTLYCPNCQRPESTVRLPTVLF